MTPSDLINDAHLYNQIVTPLMTDEHREISLTLLARKLGGLSRDEWKFERASTMRRRTSGPLFGHPSSNNLGAVVEKRGLFPKAALKVKLLLNWRSNGVRPSSASDGDDFMDPTIAYLPPPPPALLPLQAAEQTRAHPGEASNSNTNSNSNSNSNSNTNSGSSAGDEDDIEMASSPKQEGRNA
jgi:hypothetical protein